MTFQLEHNEFAITKDEFAITKDGFAIAKDEVRTTKSEFAITKAAPLTPRMFPTRMLPRNRRPNLKQLAPQQNIKQRTRNTSIYQAISPVCTGHGLVELCFIAATELPGSKPVTFKAGI